MKNYFFDRFRCKNARFVIKTQQKTMRRVNIPSRATCLKHRFCDAAGLVSKLRQIGCIKLIALR
jgi:hypothetical protein